MRFRPLHALAAAGAIALVAGGALVAVPASAHTSALSASSVCDTATGTADVTYVLTNDHPTPAKVTASTNDVIPVGTTLGAAPQKPTSREFVEHVSAPAAGHESSATLTVQWQDGFTQRGVTASTTVSGSCTAPTPTPTPTPTPPVVVVAPHVQDFITCDGASFVLDNTGSTEDVTFTVAGKPFLVPAGTAVHTDADGYLFPTDVGPYTITTTPGDASWTFAPPADCATTPPVPPTTEPTPPVTPVPTPEPTVPVTPPATPTPTTVPTPAPSDQPTAAPTSPTPSSALPTTSSPSASPSSVAVPVHRTTAPQGELAFTGSPLAMGTAIAGALALLLAGVLLLVVRHRRRSAR